MIKKFDEIIKSAAAKGPKTIAVAAAHDAEVILALNKANILGIADAILIGNRRKICRIAEEYQIDIGKFTIIEKNDNVEACRTAVQLAAKGQVQVLMKGLVDTATILKAVLDKEAGLRTANVLSHVAVADIDGYDRLFYITDGAMNIAPNVAMKKQIIENAVQIANALGNDSPKAACICALEKVNPKMQATLDAAELAKMSQTGELKGCMVAGPLALDNAVSLAAATHKGITNPVAGKADILVMPFIETGNTLYKSIVFFAQGNIAGIVAGAKVPIVLTSRADSELTKLNSIALGILMASKNGVKS
ncbi:phosphate butyryltransferase [Sporomusa acidovorans]|uniref:Phosphate acetyltransferase n=1 Tax=Sporomusa acidovorans (strain ATCC 49682 / DSM 3132 / Mol) TaxID=1123286 RepID=A0ABZ3IYY6_SPOA4|nr:phosphate butyryltransferase [Sporomusa acidovorans]OZC22162.1 phosphate acetyltransferase [Sporomusa acidovorans DSM 3132]SDE82371.1 phosphate butyryltransferase [Sporomusa acidovorans]